MIPHDDAIAGRLIDLRLEYDQWAITHVDHFWATRVEKLTPPGCQSMIRTGDIDDLADQLFEQERRRARLQQESAQIPQQYRRPPGSWSLVSLALGCADAEARQEPGFHP
ncbi:hypothetical protein [Nonomuraea typhae]|uniref:hypothetical protein n=1 Tax=Nonomuraea typhae TaxID=2603600 RepID=UPI0012F7FA8F|nr:hypothetical protein [Nonomuraea typhae]